MLAAEKITLMRPGRATRLYSPFAMIGGPLQQRVRERRRSGATGAGLPNEDARRVQVRFVFAYLPHHAAPLFARLSRRAGERGAVILRRSDNPRTPIHGHTRQGQHTAA